MLLYLIVLHYILSCRRGDGSDKFILDLLINDVSLINIQIAPTEVEFTCCSATMPMHEFNSLTIETVLYIAVEQCSITFRQSCIIRDGCHTSVSDW